ncbi:hypothetical protein GEMRC1_012387 [Eukaryota sp. GEM-RC1]
MIGTQGLGSPIPSPKPELPILSGDSSDEEIPQSLPNKTQSRNTSSTPSRLRNLSEQRINAAAPYISLTSLLINEPVQPIFPTTSRPLSPETPIYPPSWFDLITKEQSP